MMCDDRARVYATSIRTTAVTVFLRTQCVEQHFQLLALGLISILRLNATDIVGIRRAGGRRPSRPPVKPPFMLYCCTCILAGLKPILNSSYLISVRTGISM